MRITDKVKIGGVIYDVELGQKFTNSRAGEIDYCNTIISIRDGNASESFMQHVFIHEITHGILYDMGRDEAVDEVFVQDLASRLYGLIIDNPEMFGENSMKLSDAKIE